MASMEDKVRKGPAGFFVKAFKQQGSVLWTIKAWGGNRISVDIGIADNYDPKTLAMWFGDSFINVKFDALPVSGFTLAQLEQYRNDLAWFGNMLNTAKDFGDHAVTYIVDQLLMWEYMPENRWKYAPNQKLGIMQDFTWEMPTNWMNAEQRIAVSLPESI